MFVKLQGRSTSYSARAVYTKCTWSSRYAQSRCPIMAATNAYLRTPLAKRTAILSSTVSMTFPLFKVLLF